MRASESDWSSDVYQLVREAEISTIVTVPDSGLTKLLNLCHDDAAIQVVTLSTEEEGIGIGYGAWLGGERVLMCMQSSGTGNCINALSLPAYHETPCLMLVTMRGQEGEGNPAQFPMGRGVIPVFEAMGVICIEAHSDGEVAEIFKKAVTLSFDEGKSVAVIISQQIIGVKAFSK